MPRASVLAALLAAAALAACGGDDGMSAAEYRAAAKKVCTDAEKQTDAVEQPTRATPESIADYLRRLLDANRRTTGRFQELDPPEDLQRAHDDILAANAAGARTVEQIIKDLEGGDDPAALLRSATSKLREYGRQVDDGARRIGVAECRQ